MKSLVAAITLFALIIAGIVINSIYVSGVCEDIAEIANELSQSADRGSLIINMKDTWSKHRSMLDISIKHGELERMNDLIESLYSAYVAQNEAEFQKYCTLISELALDFAKHERISFQSLC